MKLAKMDQDSEIAIKKDRKHLEIKVKSGNLFSMSPSRWRTTMLVSIRGTSSWVDGKGEKRPTTAIKRGSRSFLTAIKRSSGP